MYKTTKTFYRLNQFITAPQVRLTDEGGKQIGIMTLEEALKQAEELEVDLVEVAPKAVPPVCRLIDFKKFKYLQARKEREEKKKVKEVELKEIRMGPFVAAHDLAVRMGRIREFLKDGHRVKVTVRFTGRQMTHPEFGRKLLEKIVGELNELAQVEREAKFEGRNLNLILGKGHGKKAEEAKNAEGQNQKSSAKEI